MSALDTTSATGSFWLDSTSDAPRRPELRTITQADVCVLGGGVTGVTTALLLARGGARVVLVEAGRIGGGVTGTTTGKVTALHGMAYSELSRKAGNDRTAAYAAANLTGLQVMRELVAHEGIECDWRERDAVTYTVEQGRLGDLESEYEAAREAGLGVELVDHVPGPVEVAGAIRAPGSAELHSVRYVLGLAARAELAGAVLYEGTRAVSVGDGSPCVVRTDTGGEVRADSVVVATHYPILDRGLYFARMTAMRSYAIGIEAGPEAEQEAMLYGIDSPTRSLRSTPAGAGELVVLGGEGHATGREDDAAGHFRSLERTAAAWYPGCAITHRWSAQDPVTADGLPYAGRLWPGSSRLYVATGFRKWGFTNGTAAALIVSDALLGRTEREWAGAFSPQRVAVRAGVPKIVSENAKIGWRFAADRFRSDHGIGDASELAAGEGAVVGPPHRRRAAYRDESGRLHVRSAVCTHLGCEVRWNSAEKSFDCPCHGSRFAPLDGAVLEGPAVSPLAE